MSRTDDEERPAVFRPEKGILAIFAVGAGMWGLFLVFTVAQAAPTDPLWWLWLSVVCGVIALFVRALSVQVRAYPYVVQIRRIFGSRLFEWSEVDRFEFSKWWARARLVTNDGRRCPMTGFGLSNAERLLGLRSHARDVVDVLNERVRVAAVADEAA